MVLVRFEYFTCCLCFLVAMRNCGIFVKSSNGEREKISQAEKEVELKSYNSIQGPLQALLSFESNSQNNPYRLSLCWSMI